MGGKTLSGHVELGLHFGNGRLELGFRRFIERRFSRPAQRPTRIAAFQPDQIQSLNPRSLFEGVGNLMLHLDCFHSWGSRTFKASKRRKIPLIGVVTDDKPVAAIEASGPEVRELLKEQWFLEELSTLTVDAEPIYKPVTRLRVRPATEDEWAIYDQECETAEDADEILFVYLVDLIRGRLRV